jgi:hypothetical protein
MALVKWKDGGKWGALDITWGDYQLVEEVADLLEDGHGSRKERLNQLDKDKKKRFIHLICRIKGEKVYDEKKEIGSVEIKVEDAELVIERVLGTMRVENTNVL